MRSCPTFTSEVGLLQRAAQPQVVEQDQRRPAYPCDTAPRVSHRVLAREQRDLRAGREPVAYRCSPILSPEPLRHGASDHDLHLRHPLSPLPQAHWLGCGDGRPRGVTYATIHLLDSWTTYDTVTNGTLSVIFLMFQYFGPGMIKSVLTLRTGNAWVHLWAYHVIDPHVTVDTPNIVNVFKLR